MSGEELIRDVLKVYAWLDRLELTSGMLLAVAAVLGLAMVVAAREAFSWFLKINDIKKDVGRLHEITLQLEGEIRTLQTLLRDGRKLPPDSRAETPSSAALTERTSEPVAFPLSH